ncbi:hypothetical protein RchiOBHm_Chr6g0254611 [Rosa chinensis]|uniref:KIB1-4 beta-propeller domain-containing protein n=1 Tax=Rosa chinensis TaxID=74649 RepID=A0A2P6PLP9_ROSCH|nr:hypothetical protein RchiOBHm_Chr6g0254611 [Rosa chinensis]
MMIESLFACFNPRCNTSKLRLLKRKKLPKKLEREQKENEDDKYRNQTSSNECTSWQPPPPDIMEQVLPRVRVSDQIRLSIACKSWMSIVMRRDIRSASHEFPWLLLPQTPHCSNKYVSFASVSEGRVVKLKLPKQVRGWWIFGSSKGWLIMIKERGLNSKMCLLNPISGALLQLPPLRTLSFLKDFVKTEDWKLFGANAFDLRIALSTSDGIALDSKRCTVAAVFNDKSKLSLCRPGDRTWSDFQVLDTNQNDWIADLLFSSGSLYVLVRGGQKESFVDSVTQTLNFSFGDAENLKMKLVYDKHENRNVNVNECHSDYKIVYNALYYSRLLESTSNEVLLIHQMVDYVVGRTEDIIGDNNENNGGGNMENDEDDDEANNLEDIDQQNGGNIIYGDEGSISGDSNMENDDGGEVHNDNNDVDVGDINQNPEGDEEDNNNPEDNGQQGETIDEDAPGFNAYMTTRSFRVYKTDDDNFIPLQCLGDQLFFLGDCGSFSFGVSNMKKSERNCIYFASNLMYDWEAAPKTYASRDIGIFYLDSQRIERSFPSVEMSLRYQGTWFTPSLY